MTPNDFIASVSYGNCPIHHNNFDCGIFCVGVCLHLLEEIPINSRIFQHTHVTKLRKALLASFDIIGEREQANAPKVADVIHNCFPLLNGNAPGVSDLLNLEVELLMKTGAENKGYKNERKRKTSLTEQKKEKENMSNDEDLNEFIRTVGVPKELVSDGAKAQIQGKLAAVARGCKVKQRVVEPYNGWLNGTEAAIQEIKRSVRRASHTTSKAPKRLWDYSGEWIVAVRRFSAHSIAVLNNRVPEEVVSGNTPDISEYAQFGWYQYVWYHDPAVLFPNDSKRLGCWVGAPTMLETL